MRDVDSRELRAESMTRDEALDLFERRRQAWLREDFDGYLALWAGDMTFQSPVHTLMHFSVHTGSQV